MELMWGAGAPSFRVPGGYTSVRERLCGALQYVPWLRRVGRIPRARRTV